MWIEINKDIFEDNDFRGLNYLILLLTWKADDSFKRYNLFVEYDQVRMLDLYAQLHPLDREILVMEYEKYVKENSTDNPLIEYLITNHPAESNQFSIEEAIRFFNQPVSIIVENSKNDASFIRAIIHYFDTKGLVKEHLKNGWIQFENAGGCTNVQNFIEGKLQSYNYLAARNGKKVEDYFRGIIILDSDKEYPTQKEKSQYKTLKRYLKGKKIGCHLLRKRMIENYMPDEVYDTIAEPTLKSWITVYKNQLSDEQRDFLNIPSGFPKEFDEHKVRKPIKQEILNLYATLSPSDLAILDEGFKYKNFKNEFPKFFMEHSAVNQVSLKKRAQSSDLNLNELELDEILKKIKKLL